MKEQQEFQSEISKECDKLKELLIAKNKMYGNSFFKTLDEYGKVLTGNSADKIGGNAYGGRTSLTVDTVS